MPCHIPVTNLEKIELLGELRIQENLVFRRFLKNRNARRTDQLVQQLYTEVSAQIDCTTCGNCCRKLSPYLTSEDQRTWPSPYALPRLRPLNNTPRR